MVNTQGAAEMVNFLNLVESLLHGLSAIACGRVHNHYQSRSRSSGCERHAFGFIKENEENRFGNESGQGVSADIIDDLGTKIDRFYVEII